MEYAPIEVEKGVVLHPLQHLDSVFGCRDQVSEWWLLLLTVSQWSEISSLWEKEPLYTWDKDAASKISEAELHKMVATLVNLLPLTTLPPMAVLRISEAVTKPLR